MLLWSTPRSFWLPLRKMEGGVSTTYHDYHDYHDFPFLPRFRRHVPLRMAGSRHFNYRKAIASWELLLQFFS